MRTAGAVPMGALSHASAGVRKKFYWSIGSVREVNQ